MGPRSTAILLLTTRAVLIVLFGTSARAEAYPEFQRHIQSQSGRVVSCGMCHAHPDGPDGVKHGQIGSLGQGDVQALARSRSMLDPGSLVDSPILNTFGDYLVGHLGRRRIMAYRAQPAVLVAAIDQRHDLDDDGITDAQELRDGTDPTDSRHGDPGRLFVENIRRYWFHLMMLSAATLLGLYGLSRLFRWFAYEAQLVADSKRDTQQPLPPDC